MTNMDVNSWKEEDRPAEAEEEEASAAVAASNTIISTWRARTRYLSSSLEARTHSPASLTTMTTFSMADLGATPSVEEPSEEAWAARRNKEAGERIMIRSEAWDLDLMMMTTSLEAASAEDSEEEWAAAWAAAA